MYDPYTDLLHITGMTGPPSYWEEGESVGRHVSSHAYSLPPPNMMGPE